MKALRNIDCHGGRSIDHEKSGVCQMDYIPTQRILTGELAVVFFPSRGYELPNSTSSRLEGKSLAKSWAATRVYYGQTQDIGVGGAVSDRCLDRQAMRCWLRRIVLLACLKKWSRTIFHIRLIDT